MVIKVKDNKQIDWNKKDQLLTNGKGLIVCTSGKSARTTFEGFILMSEVAHRKGFKRFFHVDNWDKHCFQIFEGEVSFSNN